MPGQASHTTERTMATTVAIVVDRELGIRRVAGQAVRHGAGHEQPQQPPLGLGSKCAAGRHSEP